MEPQEVPPLIYQLLFLSVDQTDHLVPLKHLATYFREKLARCRTSTMSGNRSQSQQSQQLILRYDSLETESSDIIGTSLLNSSVSTCL